MELNFQSYVVRIFLWVLSNPEKLSKKAVAAIQNPAHAVFVSAVSRVEITIKQSLGKLQAPEGLEESLTLITHDKKMRQYPVKLLVV